MDGEPILVDVEIRNGLTQEIRLSAFSFDPNDWNGETLGIEFPESTGCP
jgi:hypothetical protein